MQGSQRTAQERNGSNGKESRGTKRTGFARPVLAVMEGTRLAEYRIGFQRQEFLVMFRLQDGGVVERRNPVFNIYFYERSKKTLQERPSKAYAR